jgi:hypothetical protein
MTHFKLTVVRIDGLTHESEFSGWHAETAMIRFRDEAKGDKRTLAYSVFEGEKSPHSSDIVWHPREFGKPEHPAA